MFSIDIDLVQRVKVAGLFVLQFYKVLTGTLLTLFIPQNCDGQICSIKQNYENDARYHQLTLSWNVLTMMSFLTMYIFELKRENWSIKYLDIDHDKPDNALKEVIVKEKKLDSQMDNLNLYYYRIVIITMFFNTFNIGLVIKLLNENYHSQSTISCFISFTLLILMKLYNSFSVAHQSVKNDKMMSAYMSKFVSYNVLDADYLKSKPICKIINDSEDVKDTYDVKDTDDDTDISDNEYDDVIQLEEIIPITNNDD